MKLHSPRFERALKRRVRKAVGASPEMRREKRAYTLGRHYNLRFLARPALSLLLGIMVFRVFNATGHVAGALAVINLWTLFWVFFRAQNQLSLLYAASDLGALSLLPISGETMFRWQRFKAFRQSWMSLVDFLTGFGVLAWVNGGSFVAWLGAGIVAGVTWVLMLALAVLAAARLTRFPFVMVTVLGGLVLLVVILGQSVLGGVLVNFIDRFGPQFNVILPTGWPVSLYNLFLPNGETWLLILIVPIAGLIWTIPGSLARLRQNYEVIEVPREPAPDIIPLDEDEEELTPAETEAPRRVGLTEIEEIVRTRQFFASPRWRDRGWIEERLWNWLTPRERALAEFAFPLGFFITASWKKILRNALVGVALTLFFRWQTPDWLPWVMGGCGLVLLFQSLGQMMATGRAFRHSFSSGVNIPMYAAYGIGYRELARLLWKHSVVQLPAFVPFIAACGAAVWFVAGTGAATLLDAIILGLKLAGWLAATRWIFMTFAFSSGTNDTRGFRAIFILFCIATFGLLFLGLGAAGLFIPDQKIAVLFWLAAILDAYVFFRIYGWFYHRNRFDLMSLPRQ